MNSVQVFDGDGENRNWPIRNKFGGELRVIELIGANVKETTARVMMADKQVTLSFNLHATATSRDTIDLLEKYHIQGSDVRDPYDLDLRMDTYLAYGCFVMLDETYSTPDGEFNRDFTIQFDGIKNV